MGQRVENREQVCATQCLNVRHLVPELDSVRIASPFSSAGHLQVKKACVSFCDQVPFPDSIGRLCLPRDL